MWRVGEGAGAAGPASAFDHPLRMLAAMDGHAHVAPPADATAEPAGFVVLRGQLDRIHFLDWGGPTDPAWADGGPGRRARPRAGRHGLVLDARRATPSGRSPRRGDGPARPRAVRRPDRRLRPRHAWPRTSSRSPKARGSWRCPRAGPDGRSAGAGVVLAGHGYGAIVAAWAAASLGPRCAGLVLVDGGWEDLREATGMEPDEFLRGLDEPPEVLRSMASYLADRARLRPGDVGCRPGAGGPGCRRRASGGARRAGDPRPRA